jgi:transcriptional regulator with XRE-family HTH domain
METIKDRLAHIIRAKNLTATQFAEKMQIQPSNVSHILNGRNKPSLDFLIKLKDIFPEYNFDWIILGKKPITISERQSFFSEDNLNSIESKTIEKTHSNGLFDFEGEKMSERKEMVQEKQEDIILDKGVSRLVKQIIYVYEDGTFEIYNSR